VTNEAEGLVTKCVRDKKITYPIAIVPGNATDEAYGVKGFPAGAVVGPKGDVVYIGDPRSVNEQQLEEQLAKATFIPAVPEKYKEINGDLAKKAYGKAHAALEKELAKGENEPLAKAKEAIEKLAAEKLADAGQKGDGGDYAGAAPILDDLEKGFKGLPEADDAAKKLKEWKADKSIAAQIKAGEDMRKAEALEKSGDPAAKRKAYGLYADVAKKLKGTPIGDKAQAAADRLKGS
jgi:hypothetical protein